MEIIATVVGVIVGAAVSESIRFIWRYKQNVTNFKAIKAELEFCSKMAKVYIEHKIAAPLYRLPMLAYQISLSQLLSDSAINEHELRAIQEYYAHVDSFNRGLDQAEAARNNEERLSQEYSRNLLKAQKLIPSKNTADSFFTEAYGLLQKRCN